MSVKSTVVLDRTSAENRYADLIVRKGNPFYFIHQYLRTVSDSDLEEMLEEMNDQAKGGEGFENYIIKDED